MSTEKKPDEEATRPHLLEQQEFEQAVVAAEEGNRDVQAGRMKSLRELLSELPESP